MTRYTILETRTATGEVTDLRTTLPRILGRIGNDKEKVDAMAVRLTGSGPRTFTYEVVEAK